MDGRTTLEEVEANLFGGVRGRRLGGHHLYVVVSTCQRPMTVLVVIDRIALVTSPRVEGVGSFPV